VDEKTVRFLILMRMQIKGKNSREVYSGDAARQLGMAPGSEKDYEYQAAIRDLLHARYLQPHPNPTMTAQGVYLITDEGIAVADERLTPPES
jgi:hypothetical protein